MERALTKPELVAALTKSPHGSLDAYLAPARAAMVDADFYAHVVAWNQVKGQVRDAKVALPILALEAPSPWPLVENALAHLALLDPRLLVQALDFAAVGRVPSRLPRQKGQGRGHVGRWRPFVERYLREKEASFHEFERVGVQHRDMLKRLYTRYHIDAAGFARLAIVEAHSTAGRFGVVKLLPSMPPTEAAGAIIRYKIPFLIARGALGPKAGDPVLLQALIDQMSPTELVTNARWLVKMGVNNVPALRASFEAALARAGSSKKSRNTLKTTRRAEALEAAGETKIAGKLRALQERQLDKMGGIDGRWAVLADKSGSMAHTIELACRIAATLTRMVTGAVHLVFFDDSPRYVEATGQTYEQLRALAATVRAGGATSVGCAMQYLQERRIELDGIAIVSDGAENTPPFFGPCYERYALAIDHAPSVYWYQTPMDTDHRSPGWIRAFRSRSETVGLDLQVFDVTGVDDYSLPNLVQTMRVGRYSLIDEILATPLKTLNQVLDKTAAMEVSRASTTATA